MLATEVPTIEELMQVDSVMWAIENKIKLLGGTIFTLDGCEYMGDIMRDKSPEIVVMKGAQSRITTAFMLREIHALRYNNYPQGSIYYFPTEKAVEGFSKTRFGPLIADNSCIRNFMRNTNSVSIKRVGKTFLRLLGCKATQNIQNQKKDSTSVRSEPADSVVRDERDLFDDEMVQMTKDRILNSTLGREVDLGTPTMPDFGIAKCFIASDQKHKLMKCPSCNSYTCVVDEFPNSIKYRRETTHEPYVPYMACIKCGEEISPRKSEWVAKHSGRDVKGYHVPHFLNPNLKLKKVMTRYEKDMKDGNFGTFCNSILGLPYIAAEDRLRMQDVFDCCGGDLMEVRSDTGTAMAADIGKTNHVLIARKKASEKAKIIYMARVSGFNALHDIAKRFNVKSAVIDLRPYEESFRRFQKAEPYKVFGCEYHDRMRGFQKIDEKAGVYSLLRTEIFDKTHVWVVNKGIEIPRKCDEVKEFAEQCCNCAKVLEENDYGDRVYRYRKLGDEHYRNALNYLWLAIQNLSDYDISPLHLPNEKTSDYDVLRWEL